MIKAVLFDYDGTLMDTNEIILRSWRHTYKTVLGRECRDEEVTGSFGEKLGDTLKERFPDRELNELIDIYRSCQKDFYLTELKMFGGMAALVRELKTGGFLTAVVTSRIRKSTIDGLDKFGIIDCFDAVISADDCKLCKPDPEPCLKALEKLGIKAGEALFVGDSRFDIQCAHSAGLRAVLVGWTICLPEEKRTGINKPDYIIDTAGELFDIIDELQSGEA